MHILIFLFIFLFGYLAVRNFNLALSLSVFALPSYLIRFDIFGIPYTMLEVMIWVLFLVHFANVYSYYQIDGLKKWLARPSRDFLNVRVAMLVFLIAATIGVLISPNMIAAAGVWKAYFLEAILFFVIFVGSVEKKKDIENVFVALGLSVLAVFAFGVYQKFTGWKLNPIYLVNGEVDRITSVYGFPNAIGLYFAPIIALYFGWGLGGLRRIVSETKNKHDALRTPLLKTVLGCFQGLVVITGVVGVIFAKSEGALVALAASVAVLGWLIKKYRFAMCVIFFMIAITVALHPAFRELAYEKITFSGWSEQVRLSMWSETWQLIVDHPVLGVGISGYPIEFVKYHQAWYIEIFQYPHNILFNFWVEIGMLGVVSFAWLVYEFFRLCHRLIDTHSEVAFGLIAAMIALLVHGIVDVPYFKNDLSVLFWILMGVAVVLNRKGAIVE